MTLARIGLLATGMSALGRFSVRGLSLVPRPAARIMAFMGKCLKCLKLKSSITKTRKKKKTRILLVTRHLSLVSFHGL
jgi:hypothetical protein